MRARALALAGLSTLLLTACSTTIVGTASPAGVIAGDAAPDLDGPELAEASAEALEEAGSVRMVGTLSLDGQDIAVDMQMHGDDIGSIRLGDLDLQVIRIGDDAYVQGPPTIWINQGVPADTAATLNDQWVRVPAVAFFGMADTGLAGLAREIRNPTGTTVDREVIEGEYQGDPVWLISAPDGTTTSVAADGPPYPLYSETAGMGGGRFTDFGTIAPIAPPADFVDFDDLPS